MSTHHVDDRPLWVRLTHDQAGEMFILGRWFCGHCYRFERVIGALRRRALATSRACRRPTAGRDDPPAP